MEKSIDNYWTHRLQNVKAALEANNFEVFVAQNREDAKKLFLDDILLQTNPQTVSWGGSMTLVATGLPELLKHNPKLTFIDGLDRSVSLEEATERRRQGLTADMFVTGTNAVTESGQLVNLDATGNRVGALAFGPKTVVLFIGRNKLVADLDDAMFRIKNYVAPINSIRLDRKTPCVKTSYCDECKSPDRICNVWTITEKSFPKGRIKVILINEDLGF